MICFIKGMLRYVSFSSTRFVRFESCRSFATFVDPFGVKDPSRGRPNNRDLQIHNSLKGHRKVIGDPKKGLADDTTVHPFGDLRINFVRLNSSNLCFWWEYDFTGGVIRNNGQNALLSDDVKCKIYTQHQSDPERFSVEKLAEMYKIRRQRVMAILALKEIAENEMGISMKKTERYKGVQRPSLDMSLAQDDDGEDEAEVPVEESDKKQKQEISNEQWYQICDWAEREAFGASATEGSGERHFVSVPTYPKFEEIPLSEAHKYFDTEWSISRVNRMYTSKEDRFQIREFNERLLLNTGKIGKTLDFRTDRKAMRRSPPKTATAIVVTSLDGETRIPFVAEVDGTQRMLSPDEFLMWKRNNRESFTKLIAQKIKKQTKPKD